VERRAGKVTPPKTQEAVMFEVKPGHLLVARRSQDNLRLFKVNRAFEKSYFCTTIPLWADPDDSSNTQFYDFESQVERREVLCIFFPEDLPTTIKALKRISDAENIAIKNAQMESEQKLKELAFLVCTKEKLRSTVTEDKLEQFADEILDDLRSGATASQTKHKFGISLEAIKGLLFKNNFYSVKSLRANQPDWPDD
jgi:hypothetical protein